ncbi:substrate-binding domain-containing protein [Marinoscillum sp. MHG1-6]|uniref:hybrid sensor histidine kinase/response regulator transcription factor n=1 Tax=Marinoscillum sp. MHG1-6 TaxID=2959627 RepID=UPI002158027A|nr:substrate-binding domain-containing protein [Marinoscillum sp. MHG1-6]
MSYRKRISDFVKTPNRALLTTFVLTIFFISCSSSRKEETYTVGLAQASNDEWRMNMHEAMRRELVFYPEIELIIENAEDDVARQIAQIEQFIEQKVDLIIVSPIKAEPITPYVEKAYLENIPVIIIDRKTSSDLYSTYIGANNLEIGQLAGQYASTLINPGDKVIELRGLKGSTPAQERSAGFDQYIDQEQFDRIDLETDWTRADAERNLARILNDNRDVDLIFAHNDRMALGAYEICKKEGLSDQVKIIGVDGLPGANGGLELVERGILAATLLYPTGGQEAIKLAAEILRGQSVEKEHILHTTLVNGDNVRMIRLQMDKILSQQLNIERQQRKIIEQIRDYDNQRIFIYLLLGGFVIITILAALIIYNAREKQKIVQELAEKNQKVIDQQNEIIRYSKEAEEANAARFKFFTNISHEFRTPLTLISGPIEDMLRDKDAGRFIKDLKLIKGNSQRLLRLVDQLMDFRRIDNAKMKIRVAECDLNAFLRNIINSFKRLANDKGIDLQLHVQSSDLRVWMDQSMMDKVFFNLLSNAFKFTPYGGKIILTVQADVENNQVSIKVEDTGNGMTLEQVSHVFDRFYQGSKNYSLGTGLGLALTKEFVEMHHGKIAVLSKVNVGTQFEVTLPLGNTHFSEDEIMQEVSGLTELSHSIMEEEKVDITPLEGGAIHSREHSVLIIEDHEELKGYLTTRLQSEFEVISASNVQEGITKAFEHVPDLIICDLSLDGEDGFEVISTLKSDVKSSHIPIIILTAKTSMEDHLKGIRLGAEDYMTKPFDFTMLLERIHTILVNREKLRQHYIHELPLAQTNGNSGKGERKFISELAAVVEEHISDPQFGVNQLGDLLNMSRVQLYRKVKAILGIGVNDYIIGVRLKKAKHLILEQDMTVSEVAYETGFSTPAYFSTAFKNHFGSSPSDFKSKNRKS